MIAGVLVCAAVALWATAGALTVMDEPSAPRLGLLPSPIWLVILLVVLLVTAWIARARARTPGPSRLVLLALSAFLLLPWIPRYAPAAFLIWTGPLRFALWAATGIALIAPSIRRGLPVNPSRSPWIAAALAAVVYIAAARALSPRLPSGDEPHYLIIAQSLLLDHDLQIENNHRRGDYRVYWRGVLRPDYLRRGKNGAIYSIHAPGLPALVAPAFAWFGYPGVAALLAILSGAAAGLVWHVAWKVSRNTPAAWFAWAAVALSVPFCFQSFAVYPDALGAGLIVAALCVLLDGGTASMSLLMTGGAAVALLPWLHTRLAIAASSLGAVIVLRNLGGRRAALRIVAFATIPILSAVAWFWFFYSIYGTPDPRAPYGGAQQSAAAFAPAGFVGLLFDQQFGVLPNAPVYILAAFGFVTLFRRQRRLAVELLAIVAPYACAVAAFQMWWGGSSSAARFLVPVLLPLAIPIAAWFAEARSVTARAFGGAALVLSLLTTTALASVDRGALVYNVRDGASRLLIWASPLVDLALAFPSVFRTGAAAAAGHGLIWIAAAGLTAGVGALVERRWRSTVAILLVVGTVGAASAMTAATVVWHLGGLPVLTPLPASLALLGRYQPDRGQWLIRYSPMGRLPAREAVTLASLPLNTPGRAGSQVRRYGPALVALVAGDAEMERAGAWINGRSDATFLIGPDPPAAVQLFVRNAPVENHIVLNAGEWHEDLALKPREERFFQLPANRALLEVSASSGFRPSEVEPGSTDTRFLGVWIEVR